MDENEIQLCLDNISRLKYQCQDLLSSLKHQILAYVSENGGTVEIPDTIEGDYREIQSTPMAVMDDHDNIADAYIEGIRTDGTGIVIWGTRTDGDGETGECPFDAILNAVNVADFIQKLEQIKNRKEK